MGQRPELEVGQPLAADDASLLGNGRLRDLARAPLVAREELDADHCPAATQQEEHPVGAGQAGNVAAAECADRQADDSSEDADPAGCAET